MYETKLKGHDGIAMYKSLHFSADFIGNFPEVGETHVDGGCHWRCYHERINGVIVNESSFNCRISFIPDDCLRISRNVE